MEEPEPEHSSYFSKASGRDVLMAFPANRMQLLKIFCTNGSNELKKA